MRDILLNLNERTHGLGAEIVRELWKAHTGW